LSLELEQTNQGVVALYAELDDRAEQLRQANELKSRFLSYMSHEFRTPLSSILSITRILLDRLDGPLSDEQEKQVHFISNSAMELTEMVDDLLDLAKIEAGRIVVSPDWFEMVDLFSALRGMFKPILSTQAVSLIFEEPTGKGAFAPDEQTDPRIRLTWGVRVVIVNDRRTTRGYLVITAFPRNFDPYPAPSKFSMEIYRSGGVEVTYDWRMSENFAQATEFLKQLVGGPSSPNPKNPEKPRFYYFEHKRENDALDAFMHKLRRWSL